MNNAAHDLSEPVRRVIAAGGGTTETARRLGVTQSSVAQWMMNGRIPLRRVPDIERVFGFDALTLRPDFFGRLRAYTASQHR